VFGCDFRKGKFKMYDSVFAKGQFKRNRLARHIAVEIEVDRYNSAKNSRKLNEALDRWGDAVVHDGSLDGGFEINTNPCNGDLWYKHIEELSDGLDLINAHCTTACGLHCHVNAKDLSAYDLRRLILLYRKTERGLFELCEPRRMQGHYSQVCGAFFMPKLELHPDEFRRELAQKMYLSGHKLPNPQKKGHNGDLVSYAKSIDRTKKEKYHGVRYKALNLHSFFLRGTVEFRHKEGTVDYTEITNWGEICAHMIETAANWPESKIMALPGDVRVRAESGEPAVIPITSEQSREALLAVLPTHLQDFAERKWAALEHTLSRYKAQNEDTWARLGNDGGRTNY
jgi:hypothetical protein